VTFSKGAHAQGAPYRSPHIAQHRHCRMITRDPSPRSATNIALFWGAVSRDPNTISRLASVELF
jgi:hypothetical protein